MVTAAAQLLRRQGYHGTGLNQIVEESHTPKGSIYHYFPGGKEDLAAEAIRMGGSVVEAEIADALAGSSNVAEALTRVAARVIEDLKASGFQDGCPLSMVALETSALSSKLQQICSAAFASLHDVIARSLEKEGRSTEESRALANLILCAYEGALLLTRTHQDPWPLELTVATLRQLIDGSTGQEARSLE